MKKLAITCMLMAALVSAVPAHAAGKLSVTQENFHVVGSSSIYGYAYAKVENVGDKPIKINAGLLEIFDGEGDTLTSEDYLYAYGRYLNPGEYGYAKMSERIEGIESADDVDDYMLTISGKSEADYVTLRLPVETAYMPNVQYSSYSTRDYMYATVTNNTDSIIFDLDILLVLLDDDDNILYMTTEDMYDSKGITPGSSIVIREYLGSDFKNYFEANDITPTKVDALAYVYVNAPAE